MPVTPLPSFPLLVLRRLDLVQGLGERDLLHEAFSRLIGIEPVLIARLEPAPVDPGCVDLPLDALEQSVFLDGQVRNLVRETTGHLGSSEPDARNRDVHDPAKAGNPVDRADDEQGPGLAGSRVVRPDLARLEDRVGCRLQVLDVTVATGTGQQQGCGEQPGGQVAAGATAPGSIVDSSAVRLHAPAVFVSAFLLFQVQPLIGKYILPWFGSSPAVWTTAVLFFQTLLLVGYAYAHLSARLLSGRRQAQLYVALLAGAVLLLPITPSEAWRPDAGDDPTGRILLLLSASVGVPYLLLAASSPLLQAWFARAHPSGSPYRLYAVSNTGSLLALLSYPFVFERLFPLRMQTLGWSTGFAAFGVLGAACAWPLTTSRADPAPASRENAADPATSPPRSDQLLWLALAASASVVLLATINRLSQEVPAVPFLFVVPLSLYLTTFIIAFDQPRWYYRPVFCTLLPLALAALGVRLYGGFQFDLMAQVAVYSLALFACCMTCHGELVRLKPDPRHLTLFYLMVSLGGVLGGAFVAVLAPRIFSDYWEYELGVAGSYGLVMFLVHRDMSRRTDVARSPTQRRKGRGGRAGWKNRARRSSPPSLWPRRLVALAGVGGVAGVLGSLAWSVGSGRDILISKTRNFYGVLSVKEVFAPYPRLHKRIMNHGRITHGSQYLSPERRAEATTYYGAMSGVEIAIDHHPKRGAGSHQFRIGVVGLGTGTLAAYANPAGADADPGHVSDYVEFYEIDPRVVAFAEEYFTFLSDARARGAEVEVVLGDARIQLERELELGQPQRFDVLVVDAFSGDAIPMHLLTKECAEIYWAHLKPDGILAVHISNRYLDLRPVVRELAELHGKQSLLYTHRTRRRGALNSRWVLITDNERFLASEAVQSAAVPQGMQQGKGVLWTDDFSSLFELLR
jgi:hypothetical protein